MKTLSLWRANAGTTAAEFAMVTPVFLMIMMGFMEGGVALFTRLGLQNGVEAAARCAQINRVLPNPTNCGTASAIATYAAQNSFGLNIPSSTFTVTTPSCGTQIKASYSFSFVTLFFSAPQLVLTAQYCA